MDFVEAGRKASLMWGFSIFKGYILSKSSKNKKAYVYVDGFNLYHRRLKATFKNQTHEFKWLNVLSMCEYIFKNHNIEKLKFFTADVKDIESDRKPNKIHNQRVYLKVLNNLEKVEIIKGNFVHRTPSMKLVTPIDRYIDFSPVIRPPGRETVFSAKVHKYEEKRTDVNIATEMMADAFDNKYDSLILLTNDSDLQRPLEYIKSKFKKEIIILNPDKSGRSSALSKQADIVRDIKKSHLTHSQFSDVVEVNGKNFHKPTDWSKPYSRNS